MIKMKLFAEPMLLVIFLCAVTADFGSPNSNQYHIQTDEGDERYFRYQTDNGQFRKEKRLRDGTVIGTEGWIDAAGIFRIKDYMANENGYNILRSKTIFVGVDRPIMEALQIAKGRQPTSGTLTSPNSLLPSKTYVPIAVTTTTTTVAPPLLHNSGGPLYLSPYPGLKKVPAVYIRHHSEPVETHTYIPPVVPSSTPSPLYVSTPESTYLPSSTPELFRRPIVVPSQENLPPLLDNSSLEPIAVYGASSTPAPPTVDFGTPIAVYNSNPTPTSQFNSIASTTPSPFYPTATLSGLNIEQINNEFEAPHVFPHDQRPISSTTTRPPIGPLFDRSAFLKRPSSFKYYPSQFGGDFTSNGLGDGYTPQFPYYDGVSATKNGFGYYLQKQYHEEDNHDPQRRDGSFGYVDPFGIRRVIYYNTGNGFNVRHNNRYVGENGTPYDPRPL